jgi:predicted extracellular nuclease
LSSFSVSAQDNLKKNFKIVCYNVENFFDCVDDSLKADEEYLPGGMRGWNYTKYQAKQNNIAKVITAIGGWDAPALVGLCEVESRKALTDLTRYSGLKSLKYEFSHFESPDVRGIDVALLYQPEVFTPVHEEAIAVFFPQSPATKTRDILLVSGIVPTGDTLNVFVCHFPSRLGGELESENRRVTVASTLRAKVDSLYNINPAANIVVMGDFNDYPDNASITETLKAEKPGGNTATENLYNLAYPLYLSGKGTHKYEGEWGMLDQFIVSGNLLDASKRFYTRIEDARVFDAGFLLEDDLTHLGKKPFRTYTGMKFNGGFSDHLPVYCDFWY